LVWLAHFLNEGAKEGEQKGPEVGVHGGEKVGHWSGGVMRLRAE
jgi:hypothetical protein